MDKINCMRAFCQVVKEGSFSGAANKLHLSKVLVSRSIASLEESLGVKLIQRTTRKMSLTEEGKAYYDRCQALLDDFDELENSVRDQHQGVKGRLKISAPSEEFTCEHLSPFIAQFSKQFPELKFDIVLADRYIDIVEEGFDVAIRIGQLDDSNLIARTLGLFEVIVCASPDYLSNSSYGPKITHPSDLESHSIIADSNVRDGHSWRFRQAGATVSVNIDGRMRVNSSRMVKECLAAGLGIGICPSFMVDDMIRSGRLVRLLDSWQLMKGGIYVVYNHRNLLSTKVKTFVDALVDYTSSTLSQSG